MRILQIAYYFPPMGGAGVQRALKFCKYLPQHGVEPLVVCAHSPAYVGDASLLAEVPTQVQVLRIPHQSLLQRLMARRRASQSSSQGRTGNSGTDQVPAGATGISVAWRNRFLAAYAALQFPDDQGPWARKALAVARQALKQAPVDLIFSSAPPASAHWLAARLAQEFQLPWVADYRDLWTEGPGYGAPAWRRLWDRRCEARWLCQASGVVTVTPSWRDYLERRIEGRVPVAFIPNGYDEEDFSNLQPLDRSDGCVRLVHTGTFYGPRDPASLLAALDLFFAREPGARQRFRLRLVGNMGARFSAQCEAFKASHPDVLELVGYVPHGEALREMAAADALLLVVGAGDSRQHQRAVAGTLPGKIFEYLRSGRPMLLMGDPTGDAAQLLREQGHGWVADENQIESIAQALHGLYLGRIDIGAGRLNQPQAFERKHLTGQLASFLRQCQAAHQPGARP